MNKNRGVKITGRNDIKVPVKRVVPGDVKTEVAQNRRGEVLQETRQWLVRRIPAFGSCCAIAGEIILEGPGKPVKD